MADNFSGWGETEIPDAGGKFFKLKTDQVYKLVLVGVPVVATVEFNDGPAVRVRANICDLADPTRLHIIEFSPKVAGEIKDVFEMCEGGQGTILSIKKTGAGFQTKHIIVAGKSLTDEQKAKLGKLEMHDLSNDAFSSGGGDNAPDADEDMPF